MGRMGDGENGRWGEWEMGRWGDGEIGRMGDGVNGSCELFTALSHYWDARDKQSRGVGGEGQYL